MLFNLTGIHTHKHQTTILLKHLWQVEGFFILSHIVVKDVLVVLLAGVHRLQNNGEASVQGSEVGFSQDRGNSGERILGK